MRIFSAVGLTKPYFDTIGVQRLDARPKVKFVFESGEICLLEGGPSIRSVCLNVFFSLEVVFRVAKDAACGIEGDDKPLIARAYRAVAMDEERGGNKNDGVGGEFDL